MLAETFSQKSNEWIELMLGSAEDKRNAPSFYKRELMPLSIERYVSAEISKVEKLGHPKHIVLSVGQTYEPLVFTLKLFEPEKVLFLHTAESKTQIDDIFDFIELKPSQFSMREVDKNDMIPTYKAIKDAFVRWGRPSDVCIDFTGGTKAMSAGCAMAGSMIGARLIYVANDNYHKELRRPIPGSEFMEILPNPHAVFGELDRYKLFENFKRGNFFSAHQLAIETIKYITLDAKSEFELWRDLAQAYDYYDLMHFDKALIKMEQVQNQLEKIKAAPSMPKIKSGAEEQISAFVESLRILSNLDGDPKKQMDLLNDLELVTNLTFAFFESAQRQYSNSKYDAATLLLYRILELISQRRLAMNGIRPADPMPSQYKVADMDEFLEGTRKLRRSLYGEDAQAIDLTEKISLMNGYVILAALGDSIIDGKPVDYLKQINEKSSVRNSCILTHGFSSITAKATESLFKYVETRIKYFCRIESIDCARISSKHKLLMPEEVLNI